MTPPRLLWLGLDTKAARRIPKELWRAIRRKLTVIDAATKPTDIAVTPGYRLEGLKGDQAVTEMVPNTQ